MTDETLATAKKETLLNKAEQLDAVVSRIQNTLEPSVEEKSGQDTPKPANKLLQIADVLDRNVARLHKILNKLETI